MYRAGFLLIVSVHKRLHNKLRFYSLAAFAVWLLPDKLEQSGKLYPSSHSAYMHRVASPALIAGGQFAWRI
jgi:hypothetical protein